MKPMKFSVTRIKKLNMTSSDMQHLTRARALEEQAVQDSTTSETYSAIYLVTSLEEDLAEAAAQEHKEQDLRQVQTLRSSWT
ncbi:hypothetical protein SDC9_62776 [bioreactor metagenome]|uniref:Uncharacterized protein n=1 Tax=bioreactor metagenome TaxID=1076179 RepID=A0A644XK87_9ZZZZ